LNVEKSRTANIIFKPHFGLSEMSFNCDFNAPMFVDFNNEGINDSNPESYFG